MDDKAVGLNQLSRLMFDKAALRWQWSIGLELFAGAIGVCLSLNTFSVQTNLIGAISLLASIIVAYAIRYNAKSIYEDAETMRRQSVLSEGMGWEIARAQIIDWSSRAGPEIMKKAALNPRPDDYYEHTIGGGSKKLSEMTFKSAHWTRCLYVHLRFYLVSLLVGSIVIVISLLTLAALDILSTEERMGLVYAAFLIAPLVVTIDFLGMTLQLNRAIPDLRDLSTHLEEQASRASPHIGNVMRLVSEYNCIVSSGVPIPNWIWRLHNKAISDSWNAQK